MSSKVVLVTGANTGLGYQIVRALAGSHQPYEILLGARSLQKAGKAVEDLAAEFPNSTSKVSTVQIDIEDDESIEAAFQMVESKHGRLDALVNNAGAQFDPQLTEGKLTVRETWTKSWAVNTVGAQVLTSTFVPLLLKSSDPRLLFMTSFTASLTIAETPGLPVNIVPSKGWPKTIKAQSNIPAYRSAKAGLNMMMVEWTRFLKEDGVKVWALSPGYLATALGSGLEVNKDQGATDPTVAGDFVKEVLEGKRDADVGKVISRERLQPW